jgi:nitroreductase
VRLLDFIRTRRSRRHQALPPAPAPVEEAVPKERDIHTRLREAIAAARQAENGPWPSVKQANREAAHAFTPVREAAQQLAQALVGNEPITWTLHANALTLTLGQERRVRASRQGWQRDFAVEDTIACPDLGGSVAHTYAFQTPDEVITLLIRACAEFLAHQPSEDSTALVKGIEPSR